MLAEGDVMPTRSFSTAIVGGLWPSTTPDQCSSAAGELQGFSQLSGVHADEISRSGNGLLLLNSGQMAEAMHVTYVKDSQAVRTQSELYGVMSEAVRECARLIEDAKSRLDAIDRRAHDEIQKIIGSKGGWFGPLAVLAAIWAIIARARNEAIAVSIQIVRAIAQEAVRILSADAPTSSDSVGSPPQTLEELQRELGMVPGGSRNSFGLAGGFGGKPAAPPPRELKGNPVLEDIGGNPPLLRITSYQTRRTYRRNLSGKW